VLHAGDGAYSPRVDVEAIKQRQAHVWGLGNYSVLARKLEPAALELCDACAVSAGQEVLDVAAGNGNFALACAREGASVVASDLSPAMVELGRARSQTEGYEIEWVEADAEALPFDDARFDCAGSVFGVMLTPQPEVAARELFRVVRPGGTVGLTAWVPDGYFAEALAVARRFVATPDELPPPHDWGDEAIVRARFEGLAAHIESERRTLVWTAPSLEAFEAEFADNAPAAAAAREALPPEQLERLSQETLEVGRRWNDAVDGSLRLEVDYLVTVARKRG
jgi:SAM-dependent methyltransferase